MDSDRQGLVDLLQSFANLNFGESMLMQLWTIVAAVLHLGNVTFEATQGSHLNDSCKVDESNSSAHAFCVLVGCSLADLDSALCKRTISVRAGTSSRPTQPRPGRRPSAMISPEMAAALGNAVGSSDVVTGVKLDDAVRARDALAKCLFAGLFEFFAAKVNESLGGSGESGQSERWIGVLDIFGFEFFDVNGFEQLCINYANEKLQHLFTSMFVGREQVLYVSEAIDWQELDFRDNRDIIALLEQRQPSLGVFATLDEVSRTVGGNDASVVAALCRSFIDVKHPNPNLKRSRYDTDENFVVVHYAASVTYNCNGMLDRNRDAVIAPIKQFIRSCASEAVVRLKLHISGLSDQLANEDSKLDGLHRTLSSRFQLQIRELLDSLAVASCTFVRCIKTNDEKAPFRIQDETVRPQLVSSGLLDSARITQMGFPFRKPFLNFLQENALLIIDLVEGAQLDKLPKDALKNLCVRLMNLIDISPDKYKVGTTLIFFKANVAMSLEMAKTSKLAIAASLLQALLRAALRRCAWSDGITIVIRLQRHIRAFVSKCRLRSRRAAKRKLQAYLRACILKRSQISLIAAGHFLRLRFFAALLRSRAHGRARCVRFLQCRARSALANRMCVQNLMASKLHTAAVVFMQAMIRRHLNHGRFLDGQQQLVTFLLRCVIRQAILDLREFAVNMQGNVRRTVIRSHYSKVLAAARLLSGHACKSKSHRTAFISTYCGVRVVAAASARALCRAHHSAEIRGVQRIKASIIQRTNRLSYFKTDISTRVLQGYARQRELRGAWISLIHSASNLSRGCLCLLRRSAHGRAVAAGRVLALCLVARSRHVWWIVQSPATKVLQAMVRAAAVRALKTRMSVMSSKKFLQKCFRRWSMRGRYCAKLSSVFTMFACFARAMRQTKYCVRRSAAAVLLSSVYRRRACQRFKRRIEAALSIQMILKRTQARSRHLTVIRASVILAAGQPLIASGFHDSHIVQLMQYLPCIQVPSRLSIAMSTLPVSFECCYYSSVD